MGLGRRPGISLKLSALVTLLIMAELLLFSSLVGGAEEYRDATLLLFLGATLALGLFFALGLDILVTRPLVSLSQQVRRLAENDYRTPVRVSGMDEPRELGEAIEALRQKVVAQQDELKALNQELEARVEARTAELRHAQAQLLQAEKLASVGELAGGVAHEVNNPTGVILARASYLCSVADDEGFDPDVIDDLEVIVQQAERIKAITGNLLAFARRSPQERERLELSGVCQLTANLLKHHFRKRKVELDLELVEVELEGNRGALEQAVFNLLKNALEAAPEGGRVRLALRAVEGGAGAELLVDDDGPGVPEEHRHRVFDPFFTTKPVGQGTGLGLSVVYGIVSDHGGEIQVEDSPLGGARFRVRLPVVAPRDPA